MNKKINKKAKNQQMSDYWLHGYHACIAAINNTIRQKNLLIMTKEVEVKLSKEMSVKEFDFEHRIVNRHEIEKYVGKDINHQGIGLNVKKIERINIKEFILITSNYHMPRAILEFKNVMPSLKIYTYAITPKKHDIKNWLTSYKTFSLVFTEYCKFIIAGLRIKFFST